MEGEISWFDELVGFEESSPAVVRENILIENEKLISKANGRKFIHGALRVPTLNALEHEVRKVASTGHGFSVSQIVDDVCLIHRAPVNQGALIQAASQFNLLEMMSPEISPEDGIGIYEQDGTQGPACAISCGAGAIFRNYFVELEGQIGQSASRQINCLSEIERLLSPHLGKIWDLENGYAFTSESKLGSLNAYLSKLNDGEINEIQSALRIGIQAGTQVTTAEGGHCLSQAYCAAMPIGYSGMEPDVWEPIARIILNATYKATLAAAVLNAFATGNSNVYLTLVGGGVFQNPIEWICDAIFEAAIAYRNYPLNCQIVNYGEPNETVSALVEKVNRAAAE